MIHRVCLECHGNVYLPFICDRENAISGWNSMREDGSWEVISPRFNKNLMSVKHNIEN